METKSKSKFVCLGVMAIALFLASCGSSKKDAANQAATSPQDSVMVIQEETVVVEIDSLAPDSSAVTTPAKK